MRCARGSVHDVAVDLRESSPTFGKTYVCELYDENHHQLLVPAGFAHGFCVRSASADVVYKCSDFYAPGDEYGIRWDDPDLRVDWALANPVLSEKDRTLPFLKDVPEGNLPVYDAGAT